MLDLPNQEIQLQGRRRFRGFQVRHDDFGQNLSEMVHLACLHSLVLILVKLDQFPFQFPDSREGLDDSKGNVQCTFAFQDRGKHIDKFTALSNGTILI